MTIRELVTRFGFEIEDSKLKEFEKVFAQVTRGVFGLTSAVVGSGAALFALVRTSANHADEITKIANSAGVGTEQLQRLGYAASLSNSSMEELGQGLKFLNKNLYDASQDRTGAAADAFRKLNISIFDNNGRLKNAAELVPQVSAKFATMTNVAQRTALALQLFGRSGGGLVEFLRQGPQKIAELSAELDAFGGVLSGEQITSLKEFNDGLTRVFAIFSAIKNQVAAGLAPVLVKVLDQFRKFLVVNKDIIRQNLVSTVKALTFFLDLTWRVVYRIGEAFAFLAGKIGNTEIVLKVFLVSLALISAASVLVGLHTIATAFFGIAGAIWTAIAPVAAFYAAIIGLGALIFLIYEDILAYFEGKESLTEIFFGQMDILEVIDYWKVKIEEFINWVSNKVGFGNLFDLATNAQTGGSVGGLPASAVAGTVSTRSNTNYVNAPITVSVPPNTDPVQVGDRVESGISFGLEEIFGQTNRTTSPNQGY